MPNTDVSSTTEARLASNSAQTPSGSPGGSIKSAERVMDLLDLLSQHEDGQSFGAIREALSLPKSSLHGLLQVMTNRGYLDLDPDDKVYRIGVRAWQVGRGFVLPDHLAAAGKVFLREARDQLNETIQMAVLDGIENVYIAKEDSDQPLRLFSEVGKRLPAYTTGLGKVLLSALPEEEVVRRFTGVRMRKYTDQTISSLPELLQVLQTARERGYSEDTGEYTEGLYCIAVPVLNSSGGVVAAISCSIPSARVVDVAALRDEVLLTLRSAAAGMTRSL